MASLIRGLSRLGPRVLMSTCARLPSTSGTLSLPPIGRAIQPACFISTSEKNKDAVTLSDKTHHETAKPEKLEHLEEKEENWISYGYSLVDRDIDEWAHHLMMFAVITVVFCGGTFFFAYFPDYKDHAWAQREAYLELARREKEGLPLIDPNLIDPCKVELPSEEELGDFDIVI